MDLIVKLENLPKENSLPGIAIRRSTREEFDKVLCWIEAHFDQGWANETSVGFFTNPISIFIATENEIILGFAAYECTAPGFLGPIGVIEARHNQGIGRALLLQALQGLSEIGYLHAVIHDVGDAVNFYQHVLGDCIVATIPEANPE